MARDLPWVVCEPVDLMWPPWAWITWIAVAVGVVLLHHKEADVE